MDVSRNTQCGCGQLPSHDARAAQGLTRTGDLGRSRHCSKWKRGKLFRACSLNIYATTNPQLPTPAIGALITYLFETCLDIAVTREWARR